MPAGVGVQLRAVLAAKSTSAVVRSLMESEDGFDDGLWRWLADRGLLDGRPPVDVAEELGAALACVPVLSGVVLAGAVLHGSDETELRAGIAAGATTAAVSLEPSPRSGHAGQVQATPRGPGWLLDGCARQVVDGHTADVVLAVATAPAGPSLFAVEGHAAGLTRTPLVTLDRTRRQARLDLLAAPARLIGVEGDGQARADRALDAAAVHLAAEAVGGARRCLELAVAHARHREQFGRPIGAFQAVAHRLADVLVDVESARAVAVAAGEAFGRDGSDARLLASTAKAWCSQAYLRAAEACIQVQGARGVRWDNDAHLHLARAKSTALLHGDPAWHRRRVADLLGL